MKRGGLVLCASALVLFFGMAALPSAGAAAAAPRMSVEVLKALIGNPEVTVIDVRREGDYEGSATRIKSAVRETDKDISWSDKYDKGKVLVLYCA